MKALSYALLILHQTLTFQLNTSIAGGSLKVHHLLLPKVTVATFRTYASKPGDKRLKEYCLSQHKGDDKPRGRQQASYQKNSEHHKPAVTSSNTYPRSQGTLVAEQPAKRNTTTNGIYLSK